MATEIMIKNPSTGMIKTGYVGFSWTYLFFGFWVPLFRGELGVAAIHLLFSIISFGIWQFVVCFIYNRQYMTRMLEKGWKLEDNDTKMQYAKMKLDIVQAPVPPVPIQGVASSVQEKSNTWMCDKCEKAVKFDDKYCSNCGNDLSEITG